jgi:hypothetical protein
MAGCPARKSRSTCNCPILRCQIVDHLLRIFRRRLAAARKQLAPARFTSSCFQLLIIVG